MKAGSFGRYLVSALLVAGSSALASPTGPGEATPRLVRFYDFLARTRGAKFPGRLNFPERRVRSPAAFEEMRRYILTTYRGVSVRHSFLSGDHAFDCIPILEQPAARRLRLHSLPHEPPRLPEPSGLHEEAAIGYPSALQIDLFTPTVDALGNSTVCDHDTIPMRRIDLDDLSRFEKLQNFFKKEPDGADHDRTTGGNPPSPDETKFHRWAQSEQKVANAGGSSDLSIWKPAINSNALQAFSLSQEWYSNTVQVGDTELVQTVEVGWHVLSSIYGGSQTPTIFIYWTADGYKKTGCYDLCSAFVQINNAFSPGQALTHASTTDGPKYYFRSAYYQYQGSWWLNVNGVWIGYYPDTLFGSGKLATSADIIKFGGEVDSQGVWPPMGSGNLAGTGYPQAAFQKNIYYFNLAGRGFYADKLEDNSSQGGCYSDDPHNNTGLSGWNTYIFFGGPGGASC